MVKLKSMDKHNIKYDIYSQIINSELIVALGCTEPIAIAFVAAKARQVLNAVPQSVVVEVCGNIIKNTKSVVVPNTDGLKGISSAAAAGILFGDADKKLEVLSAIKKENKGEIKNFIDEGKIKVIASESPKIFYINVYAKAGEREVSVTLEDNHTNITEITLNGKTIFKPSNNQQLCEKDKLYSYLEVADIVNYADCVDLNNVSFALNRQIELNMAISEEGLKNNWGAKIGKIISENNCDINNKVIAAAAAGSDARMSGCCMPVVIVSGSGNQGITASVPVIRYSQYLNSDRETLLRALLISNLMTIHQKTGIGKLSAFCGAVSAGVGAACGIAYLNGGRYDAIAHTAVNALAIASGIICDGAKPSCAGKIAASVFVGLLGYQMYLNGQEFLGGEGIITKGVDKTIANVGRLAKKGMKETDKEIIKIMAE